MKRVLHITECLGGGVETAICRYIEESPVVVMHYVLSISGRNNDSNGEVKKLSRAILYEEEVSIISALYTIKEYYSKIQPDVIHLHSTFAGFLGRMLPSLPKSKIVYTPHCYSFLMNDKPWYKRLVYRIVEELLNLRTGILAPCGVYEKKVHGSFFLKAKTVALNNSVSITESKKKKFDKGSSPVKIGMSGRICNQKGYKFFIRLVEEVNKLNSNISFYWIGGGEEAPLNELIAANVKVSGWLNKSEAITELKNLDIYVHTAEWEGNPVSLIEAAVIGIPTFVREIPATAVFGKELCFKSAKEMAYSIQSFVNLPENYDRPYKLGLNVLEANQIDYLRMQLRILYLGSQ